MKKPRPPGDLSDAALAKWRQVATGDFWGRALDGADYDDVAEYCRLHARKAHADSQVAQHGELVSSPNGFPVQSPWLQVVNKCRADMLKISQVLRGSAGRVAKAQSEGKKEQRQAAAQEIASEGKFAPRRGPRLAVSNE